MTDTIRGLSHLNDGHGFDQYSLPFLTQPIKKRRDKTTIAIKTHLGRTSARGKGCLNEEIFLLSWVMSPLPHTLPSYLWFSKKQYGLRLKIKIRMCILSDNQMKDKRGGPPPPKKGVCKTILILLNLLFVLKCLFLLYLFYKDLKIYLKVNFSLLCMCSPYRLYNFVCFNDDDFFSQLFFYLRGQNSSKTKFNLGTEWQNNKSDYIIVEKSN